MALWFAAIALALVAFGGLTAAIDAAYQSLSRNDVANLGAGKSQRRFDAIAADVSSHLNGVEPAPKRRTRRLDDEGSSGSQVAAPRFDPPPESD
jgi:hypothetical protein